ncbi:MULTISPECIES: transposase [unclassified Candidatus Frackibacter]|uniref:transposase n=1 Tax=unclassified Candidatus Frackibacter TaxID=2648818 RepID=UPI00079585AC|nr:MULTISPECIES: transposase [unclassified Candidatus Frackibacter]KXS46000.1 MAG: transposase family protein [Candidatus Frackibacter sp. T328-2]SDC90398.1 Transposase DDE domain-containing protein [Candidatus Frackibacter sp. WG11]SEN04274.1 Transposase DDE domain-containing protein [Candidatus Frackibacter sp. WG12]SFM12024.1 Transposase DDE domain-containing protein [Candidatus Frackibacter sp. WG13]
MINYTKLIYQLKRKLSSFSKKITKKLSKPKSKFVFQVLYGLLENQTVLLSEISRALKEDITLKKTIDRLSRNFKNFDEQQKIMDDYINTIKPIINEDTIFCCDKSDIIKPHSKKLEALDRVRDGSTGKTEDGYDTFEIAALTTEHEMPVSIYSHVYSTLEKGFKSQNMETIAGLEFVKEHFGNIGIYALDRWYDNNLFFKYFTKKGDECDFVIRAKKTRDVIYKGEKMNIFDVANLYKGKYVTHFKDKYDNHKKVKFSYTNIKLPAIPDKELTLVIVRGFGKSPMILISNLKPKSKRLTRVILKTYIKRWKIEEYFRFKKQQFNLENIRVRSLNSIRTMDLILTILIGFIAIFSEKRKTTKLSLWISKLSKRIYEIPKFDYYAITDGIFTILKKTRKGIQSFIDKNLKFKASQQLNLPNLLL